jgi:hypothetical protein
MNFFAEIGEAEQTSTKLTTYVFRWMHDDGYLYDMVAAATILIINSAVPLEALKTVERFVSSPPLRC